MRGYEEQYAVKAKLTSLLLIGGRRPPDSSHCARNFTALHTVLRIAQFASAQNRPPPTKRDFQ